MKEDKTKSLVEIIKINDNLILIIGEITNPDLENYSEFGCAKRLNNILSNNYITVLEEIQGKDISLIIKSLDEKGAFPNIIGKNYRYCAIIKELYHKGIVFINCTFIPELVFNNPRNLLSKKDINSIISYKDNINSINKEEYLMIMISRLSFRKGLRDYSSLLQIPVTIKEPTINKFFHHQERIF